MKRLIVMTAATTLLASAAIAQAEEQAATEAQATPAVDTSKLYPNKPDPDKYKKSIRWGVTPVLDQLDADHPMGWKELSK